MRPPPKKALRAPILPAALEPQELTRIDGAELESCRLDACALANQSGDRARFDGVRIVGGTLSATKLTHLTWVDVLCEKCDLSMIEWHEAKLTRVEFRECRVTGAKLATGELDHVRFVECQLDYASFSEARLRESSFEGCQLREADFTRADLTGTSLLRCDLKGADFGGAKLSRVDVSTSSLNEIRIGADVSDPRIGGSWSPTLPPRGWSRPSRERSRTGRRGAAPDSPAVR